MMDIDERTSEWLIDALPAIVWSVRADTLELIAVNKEAERILKYPRIHLLSQSKSWLSLFQADDCERMIAMLKKAQKQALDCRFFARIVTGDQQQLTLGCSVRYVPDGQIPRFIVVMTETGQNKNATPEDSVATREKLESQLRQAQKMEAIGQLAGSVAHDFNNALMAIAGFSEILLMKLPPDASARQEVISIQNATEQASRIARQLLAFSRKQKIEPRVVNMNQVLQNLEPMIQRLLNHNIELRMHLDENLGQVRADAGQMEQVILNLVINARDAMPDGGAFTIESSNVYLDFEYARSHLNSPPGHYVMLAFSDTGIGMDEYTRSRIFEPFFTTKNSGTGLGLSTCFGILKQTGGEIWVYSEPGKGSTFKIYLPRVDATPSPLAKMVTQKAMGGTETILLVDDTESVRNSTAKLLAMAGYTVIQAASGREALQSIESYKGEVQLLVSDVVMPGMSGRDLAIKVRELRPSIKVLFMSGYTMEAAKNQGLYPPEFFIAKPATMQVLLSKIREVLDQ